jgi:EAL domain-containing protein (putative c-di-GMP-specific phosphodiesterase class I)
VGASAAARPDAPAYDFDVAAIIRDRDVRLVFQPIVRLATDDVVAVEALARFPLANSPVEVFTAAEALGLTAELEALILRRALHDRLRVPARMLLTVNVTPHHLLDGPVAEVLDGADVKGVVFELTEHCVLPDAGALGPAIAVLREGGALIALDDTGAGYQGLQQVAALRPDWVKVDRALVTDAAGDEVRRASLEMFARVARRVGAVTVAEGVESQADIDVLAEVGIELAQGFYLGTPTVHPRLRQRAG